jgi:imidazolonepropionase-like amidohydrolase
MITTRVHLLPGICRALALGSLATLGSAREPARVADTVLLNGEIHAAAQMHQEGAIGSIETGKQADLVVLDQNLFRVPTERISDTRVLLTLVGGRVAFDAGDPGLVARPAPAR